jgi:excinuclease UvrABC helicase subunit UvrB
MRTRKVFTPDDQSDSDCGRAARHRCEVILYADVMTKAFSSSPSLSIVAKKQLAYNGEHKIVLEAQRAPLEKVSCKGSAEAAAVINDAGGS